MENELKAKDYRNTFWKGGLGVLIALSLVGGFYIYKDVSDSPDKEIKKVEEGLIAEYGDQLEVKEEIVEIVEVDRSEYIINVLNGSGIAGEAARGKELVESANFVTGLIGNAERLDYKESIVQAGDSVTEEFINELSAFLMGTYTLEDVVVVSESDEVTIIIGSSKK